MRVLKVVRLQSPECEAMATLIDTIRHYLDLRERGDDTAIGGVEFEAIDLRDLRACGISLISAVAVLETKLMFADHLTIEE